MNTAPLVANTRDEAADGPLARALREVGLESWPCPTIVIAPPINTRELADALAQLAGFDWVAFTSAHAVDAFCSRPEWQEAVARGTRPRLAAVGGATANRLQTYGCLADVVADDPGAAALAEAMGRSSGGLAKARVLWPRADLARPTLAEGLSRAGATVVAPVTYRTVPVPAAALAPFARAFAENRLAAVAFCSPSSARYLARGLAWPDLSPLSGRVVVASIGSTTTGALEDLCARPDVQARYPSADSLAAVLADSLLARTSETA